MFDKNIKALSKRYPQYVPLVQNAPSTGRYVIQQGVGGLNIFDRGTNTMFYPNNPLFAAEQEIRNDFRQGNLNIVLGLGLGYHITALTKIFPNIDMIIVFEADPELVKTVFGVLDMTKMLLSPNITFCMGDIASLYPSVYQGLLHQNAKYYMKAMNFIPVSGSYGINKEYYADCMAVLRQAVGAVMNLYGNDPADAMIGIHNTFINIDEIIEHPGVKELKNAFKGKPGIVVSTGPSLLKNIDLLHEVAGKAVVTAVDASLKVMLPRGLKPHMITSLERMIPTAKLLEDISAEEAEGTYLAACPVLHPQTYANWPGERIVAYRDFATFKWLGVEKGILQIGPSAANMAYKILEYMGCDPIVLIGQDLAFSGELTHAEGTTYGAKQDFESMKGNVMVPGNYEPLIRTTPVWNLFRQFFEHDISLSTGTVINATEGGAKINGAQLMTFREVIDKYIQKPFDVESTLKKRLTPPAKMKQERDRANVYEKVIHAISFSDKCIKSFDEGIQYAMNLLDDSSNEKLFNQCEEKMKIFGDEDFYQIMMHYVQAYFIKSILDINMIKGENKIDELERRRRLVPLFMDLYSTMKNLIINMKTEFELLKEHLENKNKA